MDAKPSSPEQPCGSSRLVAWFIWGEMLTDAGFGWWLWMCITGIALGVIGLVVVQVMRRS